MRGAVTQVKSVTFFDVMFFAVWLLDLPLTSRTALSSVVVTLARFCVLGFHSVSFLLL